MNTNDNAPNVTSHQDATRSSGSEAGNSTAHEIPLEPDDETPVEEGMAEVDAFSLVSSQRQKSESPSQSVTPDIVPEVTDRGDDEREPRGAPASDPESGA